jgi:uncharacterized protein YbjT (DUF2867 family)
MTTRSHTVLVVGATGTIGRHVVAEAVEQGYQTFALVRDRHRAGSLPAASKIVLGDLTEPATLRDVVEGIDAVVFTHGSHGGKQEAEAIDYAGVRNILTALGSRPARIALMTSIGVTNRQSSYNRTTQAHDWKRRSERLVRASGRPYTIVRPGWFDYNNPDEQRLLMLQGDTRQAGDPSDGAVSRRQIAQTLVASLAAAAADHKTLELVAEPGPAPADLDPLFAALLRDPDSALDAVRDTPNMPIDQEPDRVRKDLETLRGRRLSPGQ